MSSKFETFRELHQSVDLLVLPNAWDAKSALLLQGEKFPAIATSSAAVASSLGYEDGEGMSFEDYLFVIRRILSVTQVPLSVDMEMGYGTSDEEIYANVCKLVELGVAGINIEDSAIGRDGRGLKDARLFAKTIAYLKNGLVSGGSNLFVNVRCDTFILNVPDKQQETSRRAKLYETAGADGLFLPCICQEEDIAEVVRQTKLPLNVMCIPGLPGFEVLAGLGVKRVSMGPFLFEKVYEDIGRFSRAIAADKSFLPLFS